MINFILDINVVFFGFFLFALIAICVYSVDFVKNPKAVKGLFCLGIFLFFIFCLYSYFVIFLSNYSHKKILKEEISKEYNVSISIIATDTLGFFLCERSDYKSQICKEYISYFISKEVRYEQELKKAKKQKMQEIEEKKEKETQRLKEKEEEKKNFKNRIWHIIKGEINE